MSFMMLPRGMSTGYDWLAGVLLWGLVNREKNKFKTLPKLSLLLKTCLIIVIIIIGGRQRACTTRSIPTPDPTSPSPPTAVGAI